MPENQPVQPPTFREAFRFWLKLGFISFGGPTGQIAIMHAELVEKRRWISESRFLHALNFCMLLPGPEAAQLATYIGWLLHRTRGGIVAGVFFVLPSIFLLWALSLVYVKFGTVPAVAALFYGLKPAVVAIVGAAVLRLGSRALKHPLLWSIAAGAFVAVHWMHVPFPFIVLTAAVIGYAVHRVRPGWFAKSISHAADKEVEPEYRSDTKPTWRHGLKVLTVCLVLWWAPVMALAAWLGWEHVVVKEGVFFSKAAMVTFGGAYAVLHYVSAHAISSGWLNLGQMADGLGLAETTPGPLIMVLQFVGFVGGWQNPGALSPLVAATLGAAITTWTTFVPCFLWIFLGAPHIEQLRNRQSISAALTGVTAAVVGVIVSLAWWFGAHVFRPEAHGGRTDWFSVAVSVVALVGLWRWKWGVVPVILGGAVLGILYHALV